MRTSTRILGTLERWLTHPGWIYCNMWLYPPLLRSAPRLRGPAAPIEPRPSAERSRA